MPCRFCAGPDGVWASLFWIVLILLWLRFVKNPELHDLTCMEWDHWPVCLTWHGWLPLLSGVKGASLWRGIFEGARNLYEVAMVAYSPHLLIKLEVLDCTRCCLGGLPTNPNIGSDGSLVLDEVSDAPSAGSDVCAHLPRCAWGHRK